MLYKFEVLPQAEGPHKPQIEVDESGMLTLTRLYLNSCGALRNEKGEEVGTLLRYRGGRRFSCHCLHIQRLEPLGDPELYGPTGTRLDFGDGRLGTYVWEPWPELRAIVGEITARLGRDLLAGPLRSKPWRLALKTPIPRLGLSTRVQNALMRPKNAGNRMVIPIRRLRTVEDLCSESPALLLRRHAFGRGSLSEVETCLQLHGLSLAPNGGVEVRARHLAKLRAAERSTERPS